MSMHNPRHPGAAGCRGLTPCAAALLAAALLAAALLAACSTTPTATRDPVTEAVATPLTDLNIVRAEIPPALRTAQRAPYALPADRSCAALAAEIGALDAVLGADLDSPAVDADPGLVERGSTAVGDAAVGTLRGAAEGVVPLRRWVRALTGAERYAREVSAAIAAGTIRRAFLKGLGQAAGCTAPAAPAAPAAPSGPGTASPTS
ncbi:MAG: hypothetical protein ACK5UM_10220 [Pseudomonadota bacterium]|jgi:hypothetical protein|nr:hypothetical protein [Rubrivivax sp.]MCA3258542.1 hypothetical protein [Rubrivivax sp.]